MTKKIKSFLLTPTILQKSLIFQVSERKNLSQIFTEIILYVQDLNDIKMYPAQMPEGKAIPEKNTVATISITLDYTAGLFGGNSLIFFYIQQLLMTFTLCFHMCIL